MLEFPEDGPHLPVGEFTYQRDDGGLFLGEPVRKPVHVSSLAAGFRPADFSYHDH